MSDIVFTSALELSKAVRRKRISVTEIADAFLRRIEEVNPGINAYVIATRKPSESGPLNWTLRR